MECFGMVTGQLGPCADVYLLQKILNAH